MQLPIDFHYCVPISIRKWNESGREYKLKPIKNCDHVLCLAPVFLPQLCVFVENVFCTSNDWTHEWYGCVCKIINSFFFSPAFFLQFVFRFVIRIIKQQFVTLPIFIVFHILFFFHSIVSIFQMCVFFFLCLFSRSERRRRKRKTTNCSIFHFRIIRVTNSRTVCFFCRLDKSEIEQRQEQEHVLV